MLLTLLFSSSDVILSFFIYYSNSCLVKPMLSVLKLVISGSWVVARSWWLVVSRVFTGAMFYFVFNSIKFPDSSISFKIFAYSSFGKKSRSSTFLSLFLFLSFLSFLFFFLLYLSFLDRVLISLSVDESLLNSFNVSGSLLSSDLKYCCLSLFYNGIPNSLCKASVRLLIYS